jgi:hypothetical protein
VRVCPMPPRACMPDGPLDVLRAATTSRMRINVVVAGLVVRTDVMSVFPSRHTRQPASCGRERREARMPCLPRVISQGKDITLNWCTTPAV